MIFYHKPEYLKVIKQWRTVKQEDIPAIETSDWTRLCKHPIVSVVVTTFNQEQYIRAALDSVLMQKADFEYEVLVGDDCSTDQTGKICAEYQRRYPERVRFITAEVNVNKLGGNGARLSYRARGKYIAKLEGDDFWTDPDKLQKQFEVLESHPDVGICFCRYNMLRLDGRVASSKNKYFDDLVASHGDGQGVVFTGDDYFTSPLGGPIGVVMYRAGLENYDELSMFYYRTSFTVYYLILRKSKGYLLNQAMMTYRVNPHGVWSGKTPMEQARFSYEYYGQLSLHEPNNRHILNMQHKWWRKFRVHIFPYAIYFGARRLVGRLVQKVKRIFL